MRARARTHTQPRGAHVATSVDGDMENGRSGIEARLIVLDNSGAGAYATIPGRCWPGLADWLAGSRECSLPLSLSLSLSLSLFLSLSLSLTLSHSLSPYPPLPPRRHHPPSLRRSSLSSRNPFLSAFLRFVRSATLIPRYIMHFYILFTLSTCRFIFGKDATRFSVSSLTVHTPFAFSVGLA